MQSQDSQPTVSRNRRALPPSPSSTVRSMTPSPSCTAARAPLVATTIPVAPTASLSSRRQSPSRRPPLSGRHVSGQLWRRRRRARLGTLLRPHPGGRRSRRAPARGGDDLNGPPPRRRKLLPRFSVCLLPMGCLNPYLELRREQTRCRVDDGSWLAAETTLSSSAPDLSGLVNMPFAEWFTWCMR